MVRTNPIRPLERYRNAETQNNNKATNKRNIMIDLATYKCQSQPQECRVQWVSVRVFALEVAAVATVRCAM